MLCRNNNLYYHKYMVEQNSPGTIKDVNIVLGDIQELALVVIIGTGVIAEKGVV